MKENEPVGCEFWIRAANRSTLICGLLELTVTVAPPHGEVPSASSSNPAVAGYCSMKCAVVKLAKVSTVESLSNIVSAVVSEASGCDGMYGERRKDFVDFGPTYTHG